MNHLKACFKLATALSLLGWLLLVLLPHWPHTTPVVVMLCAGALSVLYVYLLVVARPAGIDKPRGGFSSLDGVIRLFGNPRVVLAGWVHFLAFDLMVAVWIKSDALTHDITHLWLVPIYLLTLLFGPAGLLVYLLLRAAL